MTQSCRRLAAALAAALACVTPASADDAWNDPVRACDHAAIDAEAEWHLPAGLLSAIGTVESGRGGLGLARPVAWPWSINADGRDFVLPSKPAAIATARALQAAGRKAIDVGCFQIDLFYHPEAFATLEMAFDPAANARAAARILAYSRFGGETWDRSIALYHSATPIRGLQYLRQVQAAWPWARTRRVAADDAYAVLLSPEARQVRVISPADVPGQQAEGLPRVVGPQDATAVLQWAETPQDNLTVVLLPAASATPRRPGRRYPQ